MMNRIILIGNGFDLAHGLPTSYADFIRGYNITLKLGLLEGEYERYDGLCSVNISDPEDRKTLEQFRWMLQDNTFRFIRNLGEITPAEQYDHFVSDHLIYESEKPASGQKIQRQGQPAVGLFRAIRPEGWRSCEKAEKGVRP